MIGEWDILRPPKILVVFGFFLVTLSVFLPWLTAVAPFVGTISRLGFEFSPEIGLFAIAFLIIGFLVAGFYDKHKRSGSICLAMSAWMLIEFGIAYPQLLERVHSVSSEYTMGWLGLGIYLLPVGSVVAMIGSLWLMRSTVNGSSKSLSLSRFTAPMVSLRDQRFNFCTNCGIQFTESAQFCQSCGEKRARADHVNDRITRSFNTPSEQFTVCPRCGGSGMIQQTDYIREDGKLSPMLTSLPCPRCRLKDWRVHVQTRASSS